MKQKIGFGVLLLLIFSLYLGGCTQKDSDMQMEINQKLFSNAELRGVTATVNEGKVSLDGKVTKKEAKLEAEAAAKEVKGVQTIENNIRIDTPGPQMPPPVVITDSVSQSIAEATKAFPTVTATFKNGELILSGTLQENKMDSLLHLFEKLHPEKITNQIIVEK